MLYIMSNSAVSAVINEDGGPTLTPHCFNVSSLPGAYFPDVLKNAMLE